jgi:hypothetical protein
MFPSNVQCDPARTDTDNTLLLWESIILVWEIEGIFGLRTGVEILMDPRKKGSEN